MSRADVLRSVEACNRNGMKLAIKEYNDKQSSCRVKEVDKDSQGDPAQAPALAQNLAQDKNVVALIGPPFSGESKTGDHSG